MKRLTLLAAAGLAAALTPGLAAAHGGGMADDGCHNDRKGRSGTVGPHHHLEGTADRAGPCLGKKKPRTKAYDSPDGYVIVYREIEDPAATARAEELARDLEAKTAEAERERRRAEKAEGEIAAARAEARKANRRANRVGAEADVRVAEARELARTAEAKTAAVLTGAPLCPGERKALGRKMDEWYADKWRDVAGELLRCLSIGE